MKVDNLIADSIAPSTKKVYDKAVSTYLNFCQQYDIKDKYCSETIELFVAHLAQTGIQAKSIKSTLSGIRHHCDINYIDFHHNTPRISMMLRGIARSCIKSTRPKNAVRISHLKKICNSAAVLFETKVAVTLRSLFTMAFFAMLRPSEMLHAPSSPQHQLKRSSVMMKRDKIKLTFDSYKHSDGAVSIHIQRMDCDILVCPWRLLNCYLSQYVSNDCDPLYPYSVCEVGNMLQQCLAHAGVKTALTLHSFRRGGATWYSEQGITNAKLAAIGRWKSNAYLRYVKP